MILFVHHLNSIICYFKLELSFASFGGIHLISKGLFKYRRKMRRQVWQGSHQL